MKGLFLLVNKQVLAGGSANLAALGLLGVAPYLPAMLWGGFVWDDGIWTDSQSVQGGWSGLWRLWSGDAYAVDDTQEGHYWPLVYTTFWLEHKLWGFAPTGYHVVNVLLHLANTILLWHLLRRLAVPGAWAVAAVFAVHPVHVESVAWVIERKDVLSGLFYLAAVLVWIRFVEEPNPRRYVCSLALYAAGLLSKSVVVTLPVALLIWHWWKQDRVTSSDLLRLVPFFVVGLAILVGDVSFYRSIEAVSFDYSLTERTLIAARALWFYTGKLMWPSDLAVIYPRWDIHATDLLAWGYLVAAVAVGAALWRFRLQLGKGPLAGTLFFAVTLSPVLGFVDYGYMRYAFVADRFQYLAGIGVMAVVISAAAHGASRLPGLWQKGVGYACVVLVLALLTMRTLHHQQVWANDESLWRHVVRLNPDARWAHYHLALLLAHQGRSEEALPFARTAIQKDPNFADAHNVLGAILKRLGHFNEAEAVLRRAIALKHNDKTLAHYNLGVVLLKQGREKEALAALREAVRQYPDHKPAKRELAEVEANFGATLNALGRFEEAETHLRRAIELAPKKWSMAHASLVAALFGQERYGEAFNIARIGVIERPESADAHNDLGAILAKMGRYDEAMQRFDRALALNPAHKDAHNNRRPLLELAERNK